MKPEVAEKWIAALRSGKYQQGQYCLRQLTEDGPLDCCLGVLCDVAISNGIELQTKTRTPYIMGDSFYTRVQFSDTDSDGVQHFEEHLPPKAVRDWAGLSDEDCEKFAEMNDGIGLTFSEIADQAATMYLNIEIQEGGEN